jgi:hypothetical protein
MLFPRDRFPDDASGRGALLRPEDEIPLRKNPPRPSNAIAARVRTRIRFIGLKEDN